MNRKNLLLVLIAVIFTLEVPVRGLEYVVQAERDRQAVLPGAYPKVLADRFWHDYGDPKTKIQHDFDMYLGWRTRPNQRGETYQINGLGRRDSFEYENLNAPVIFLTGGSAAWSLGASSNAHMISVLIQERINAVLRPPKPVTVLNLAEQAYGMRQEGITVLDYIDVARPSLVVFYDGVNDLHTISYGKDPERFRTWTYFPTILKSELQETTGSSVILTGQETLELSMTYRAGRRLFGMIRRLSSAGRDPNAAVLEPEQKTRIRSFFRGQILHDKEILDALGIASLFVIQPIGYVDKPIHDRETFLKTGGAWWRAAYGVLNDVYGGLQNSSQASTVSLTTLFKDQAQQIYLDPTHMNDAGYEAVADALADVIIQRYGSMLRGH